MKIAIIGGSIAGCALAVLLKDQFDVQVFERSKDLKSRGAGITMPAELVQTLMTKDIIDHNTPSYTVSSRSFYCQLPSKPKYGHCIWQQKISAVSLHWDSLFANLRKRVPDNIYKNESKVIEVKLRVGDLGQITLESGETQEFDLIVFVDGVQSLGRNLISTNSELTYSGYVAWRGTFDYDLIEDKTPFIKDIPYYCFNNGHLLAYPVYHENVKKLNWVFYEKLALEELDSLGTTTVNNFSETAIAHLQQLAKAKLPETMAQIVINTQSPFMQKIVDVNLTNLITKGALLLGDAGVVLRPHVGNGAALAIQDALSLSEQLLCENDLQLAIAQWENNILANRLGTYNLSKRMADALVLNPDLWQSMDESKMEIWWEKIQLGERWYITDDTLSLSLQ